MREDLLPEEISRIDESTRCESCNHLIIFHQMMDDGYGSYCEIGECDCVFVAWEGKWIKREIAIREKIIRP